MRETKLAREKKEQLNPLEGIVFFIRVCECIPSLFGAAVATLCVQNGTKKH